MSVENLELTLTVGLTADIKARRADVEAAIRFFGERDEAGLDYLGKFGLKPNLEKLKEAARQIRLCEDLSKTFRMVSRNSNLNRQVKGPGSKKVDVPLVFAHKLPLPTFYTEVVQLPAEHRSWRPEEVEIKTRVPSPTPEALRAIKEHESKFDHLELWWVPNDILVTPIEKPDPILVGYVGVPHYSGVYFELHRWVDESVESKYWAKEGY